MDNSYKDLEKKEKVISFTLLALIIAVVVAATTLVLFVLLDL